MKKPHKKVRTGCLAQMTICRQSDGRYCVIHFEANHDHEVVGPESVHALPSQRRLTVSQALEDDIADRSWIQSVENQAYVASCLCMFLSIFRILFFPFFNFPELMQFTVIITVIIIFDLESF